MSDFTGEQFGNYILKEFLGEGSFAEVYRGEHIHLGDQVQAAIKVLTIKLTAESLKDFREEALIIMQLEHPHIVRVLDFGMKGRTPYLIMSYAPKGSLRKLHPLGTRLPSQTIVTYVKQAASALQFAHDRKRIHRDVKPDNMLLGRNGEVLISDFGLVTAAHRTQSLYTQKETAGSPAYMAPEQIQGKPRPDSDQYSLGIVVYEWLTGTLPFMGSSQIEIALKHIRELPPSLRERVSTIPIEVEKVVLKALEKDPRDRFESVQEFATALEQACQQQHGYKPVNPIQPVQPVGPVPAAAPQRQIQVHQPPPKIQTPPIEPEIKGRQIPELWAQIIGIIIVVAFFISMILVIGNNAGWFHLFR